MRVAHCLMIVAAVQFVPAAAHAQQRTGPEAHLRAKITQDSARAVALARVPRGTVEASELTLERGLLVYIYDISVPGTDGLEELQVSAADAEVVSQRHLGDTGALSGSDVAGSVATTRRDSAAAPRPRR
jgi:hypothetical protein